MEQALIITSAIASLSMLFYISLFIVQFFSALKTTVFDTFIIGCFALLLVYGGCRLYFAFSYDQIMIIRFTTGQCVQDDGYLDDCITNVKTIYTSN